MNNNKTTRRGFLKATGGALGGAWLAVQWPVVLAAGASAADARDAASPLATLQALEARDLEAIAAQIIPSDAAPGAREAGVVYFMDTAFGGFMAGALPAMREGLADWNGKAASLDPAAARFAELAPRQQQALIEAEEDSPLFGMLQFLTIAGFLSMPGYGGNRDQIGWKLIGFDHRHAWQPPFGFYDAEAMKAGGEDA